MNIRIDTDKTGIAERDIEAMRPEAGKALDRLWSGKEEMTGWVRLPAGGYGDSLEYILNLADVVKSEAELFVVVGIGGSYLGARAAIEALPKYESGIPVKFLGNNLCTDYFREAIEEIKRKKTILCVISKSGSTVEVRTAFEIVKPLLADRYGSEEEAAKRIIAITDAEKGALREEAELKGYTSLSIPEDIGGRYSVLTPAGLLPMAVSGIDIRTLLAGAAEMAESPEWDGSLADYAISRYLLQKRGKEVEFIELCHSRLGHLVEWIRQLFGESEGKGGGGLLPTTLTFSTDLHSMGQYLQQGRQIFMETMLVVDEPSIQIVVPSGPQEGKTIAEISEAMIKGVIGAHRAEGIPIVEIHMDRLDAGEYGQLLYFLETTCAISAMLSGINPFDQPGVENYKAEMHRLLD